ncbi:hypothetical protein SSX86_009478 [Deinandra increscens subsp. villosa]|uniref:Uncharacterized protein n=1 Tax=Deinandra increscens subsp. villosa TaxID=3103831 RepID=A0AAP0DDF2_9ASTR
MKDDSTTTTCSQCGLPDRKILHHVRLSGTFRRLCTTCVLRLHPKSFCPSCLTVYHRCSPPDHAFVCHKCHSSSHPTCMTSPSVSARSPCSACSNPNALVFDVFDVFDPQPPGRGIGLSAARLLVAAAEISWMSMSKAEGAAVTEAEWRAKEASEWKKKAKDAVNHVVKLMEIEKKKRGGDNRKDVVDDGDVNGDDNSIGSVEVFEGLNGVKLEGGPMCAE